MGLLEDPGGLHPYGAEGVDVEKAAVVDLVGGGPPVGEAVDLLAQDSVQQVEAAGIPLLAIEDPDILIDERLDGPVITAEGREPQLDHLLFPIALPDQVRIALRVEGEVRDGGHDAQELLVRLVIRGEEPLQFLEPVGEEGAVGLGDDGEPVLVVADEECPFLEGEDQFPLFQSRSVLVAEDRNEHLVGQLLLDRRPVHIEKGRVGRAGAVFHEVEPPLVASPLDAHVVRDEVEYLPHAVAPEAVAVGVEVLPGAEFRVQAVVVDDVVAVHAPGPGLEEGGGIDVAHPQGAQVGNDPLRILEAEPLVELEAVGCRRYPCLGKVRLVHG